MVETRKKLNTKIKVPTGPVPVKLTANQVIEIMKSFINGAKQEELAKKYGVSQSRISKALRGNVEKNKYTFDSDGNSKPKRANDLLFEALKIAISKKNEAEKKLEELKKQDGLEKKSAEKTKKLKLIRNENNRLRKRINTLNNRLQKAKLTKK